MIRRLSTAAVFAIILIISTTGCSTTHKPVASKSISVGDLVATVIPDPNPARTGLNTLLLTLSDSSGNRVPNANISATAVTTLTGNTGATESARSDGNGSYRVPIHTPVSELYIVTFTIQRTGHKDVIMKYGIKPE